MREDLLKELEGEYARQREENEEIARRRQEQIRREQPAIAALAAEREQLIFGTLRQILDKTADVQNLPERMERLSARIREALVEQGFAPDYLAPVFRCSVCQDRGWVGERVKEPCDCLLKAYQQKLRQRIGLAEDAAETFETFNPGVFSDEPLPGRSFSQRMLMNKVKQDCQRWTEQFPRQEYRDLMLMGPSGLGKTFLMRAMAKKLIQRQVNVLLLSAYRLVEIARKSYFSSEEEGLQELLEADVLFIDDLGSEPLMQNVTVEQLYNLLNERHSRGRSTVISTNLDMEEFRTRYTERIASRLRDRQHCRILILEGRDVRTGGA